MEAREKIILVHYIDVSMYSKHRAMEKMSEYVKHFATTNDDILNYFIPVNYSLNRQRQSGQQVSIECINPKLVSKRDYDRARSSLVKAHGAATEFLNTGLQTLQTEQ